LVTSTSTSTSSTTRQPTIRHGENNQQQYLPRGTNYADNTNILDIDPKHLGGILCAIAQSYSIIPGGLESLIRRVYTEYQIRLVEDPSSDNWKKFFLLPTILFDARREMNNKERKCSIKSAAEKLLSQDWSSFTLSFYTRRSNSHKETQEQESVHKRVSKQVRSGELSKGLKTLNSDRRIVPLNQDTFDQLKSKFPLPCDHNVPVDEVRQTMEFAVPRDEKFSFTEKHVEKNIMSFPKTTAPGFDKVRPEFIQVLWSPFKDAPYRELYRFSLTQIVNKIANGDIPRDIAPFIQDIPILGLPKGPTDVRPIALQIYIKKLACKCSLKDVAVKESIQERLISDGLQYCLTPFGIEHVSLFFRTSMAEKPHWDFYAMDAKNGFNQICRITGLNETRKRFPQLLPYLRLIYGQDTTAWFYGLPTGIERIESREGCQQGDVMSMFFYALTIHPFLQQLRDILGQEGFNKCFADDLSVHAPFEKMIQVIPFVQREGPKCGYFLNLQKGTYLMGKCESLEVALLRKNQLIALGVHENSIKIHPDNEPDSEYIVNVLGTYIGSDRLVKEQLLSSKLPKIKSEIQSIKSYDDAQTQHLFLKWCISMKVNHTLRGTPPSLTSEFVEEFDKEKKSLLEFILDKEVNDFTWKQACLPTKDGGLGYQNLKSTVYPAFIASVYQAARTLQILGINEDESQNPVYEAFRQSMSTHSTLAALEIPLTRQTIPDVPIDDDGTLQSGLVAQQTAKIKSLLYEQTNDTKHLAWLVSLSGNDSMSSRWLDVCPKKPYCTFSSDQFNALLNFRLHLRQNKYIHNSRCTCRNAPLLDPQGHHLSMGCAKEGTYYILHDSLKLLFREFLSLSGTMVRLEEQGCFQEAFPDSHMRPDITLYNNFHPNKRVVCDIAVTHPYPITGATLLTRDQALRQFRAAESTYQRKKTVYQALCDANNLEFRPLIFESTGKLHPECRSFFDRVINIMTAGEHSYITSLTKHYWSSRISCCIQKCIADAFLKKSRNINGNLIRNCRYSEPFLGSYRLPTG